MPRLQLANRDARLVYLAMQYHLARAGAELDPRTQQPVERGLAVAARELEPQLDQAVATVELDEGQWRRLLEAVSGALNELKTYPLLDERPRERGGGRHTVLPAFDAALRRLFPEVEEEPDEATQLAGHLLALRRRLERAASSAEAEAGTAAPSRPRPWWRFWSR
jgi:hypothetical protein